MKEAARDREAAGSGGFFENTAAQAAAPLPPADSFAPAKAGLETAAAEGGALDVDVYKRQAHYCVSDAQNAYKMFVLVLLEQDGTGMQKEVIQYYTLSEGERLIDAAPPVMRPYIGADGFIKPVWELSLIHI